MEEIYQIISEYKNLHPLRFWTGVVLTLTGVGLIITFLRKRRKIDNQRTSINTSVNNVTSTNPIQESPGESAKGKESTLQNIIKQNESISTQDSKTQAELKNTIKPNQNSDLHEAKIETQKSDNKILKVNYTSSKPDRADVYPIFRCTKINTVVRSYRVGATKRRGFKEEAFQRAIEEAFGNDFVVSGELRINTGKDTRPFEPDIALINKKNDCLRIDVEIDEPYAGITRQPIHCKGDDTMRDIYFVDRGWIVIRFSEYQAHMYEKDCLRFISDIIKAVSSTYSIPESLARSTNQR